MAFMTSRLALSIIFLAAFGVAFANSISVVFAFSTLGGIRRPLFRAPLPEGWADDFFLPAAIDRSFLADGSLKSVNRRFGVALFIYKKVSIFGKQRVSDATHIRSRLLEDET